MKVVVFRQTIEVGCNSFSSGLAMNADQKVEDQKCHAQLRQAHYHDQPLAFYNYNFWWKQTLIRG